MWPISLLESFVSSATSFKPFIALLFCLFVAPGDIEISLLILVFSLTIVFYFSIELGFLCSVFSFFIVGLFLTVCCFTIDLTDYFDKFESSYLGLWSSPLGLYSGSVSIIFSTSEFKLSCIELILLASGDGSLLIDFLLLVWTFSFVFYFFILKAAMSFALLSCPLLFCFPSLSILMLVSTSSSTLVFFLRFGLSSSSDSTESASCTSCTVSFLIVLFFLKVSGDFELSLLVGLLIEVTDASLD